MNQQMVKKDKYVTTMSDLITMTDDSLSYNVDLMLPILDRKENSVLGKVTNLYGTPISGAYVGLYDKDKKQIRYAVSNESGHYIIRDVPSYEVLFLAAGYKYSYPSEFIEISLAPSTHKTVDISLESNKISSYDFISGTVSSEANNMPISGAVIRLYKVLENKSETLTAITYTGAGGQYSLRHVPIGDYSVKVMALGFTKSEIFVNINTKGELHTHNFALATNATSKNSTISGVISDKDGNPIQVSDVLLYRVYEDGDLSPVALTQTNNMGSYLFVNVEAGNYKVLSSDGDLHEAVPNMELKAPRLDTVALVYSATQESIAVDLTRGIFEGPASIDHTHYSFVSDIGDANGGGSVSVLVDAPYDGDYRIAFDYFCKTDCELTLSALTNGYMVTQKFENTSGEIKTGGVTISLQRGKNVLALRGGTLPAPSMGTFFISKVNTKKSFSYKEFTGRNPESVYNDTYKGIEMRFPPDGTDAFIEFEVNADIGGEYYVSVFYIRFGDLDINVDVNGVSDGSYGSSGGFGPPYDSGLTMIVKLNRGRNTIRIYQNDTLVLLPIIKSVTYEIEPSRKIIQAESGTMENGAKQSGRYVTDLGGNNGGSVSYRFSVPVPETYDLVLTYVSEEISVLNVEVNGNKAPENYFFDKTPGSEVRSMRIPVKFDKTDSIVKLL